MEWNDERGENRGKIGLRISTTVSFPSQLSSCSPSWMDGVVVRARF